MTDKGLLKTLLDRINDAEIDWLGWGLVALVCAGAMAAAVGI